MPENDPTSGPTIDPTAEAMLALQRSPKVGELITGLLFTGLGLWLAFSYLPSHSPDRLHELERQAIAGILNLQPGQSLAAYLESKNEFFFKERPFFWLMVACWFFIIAGGVGAVQAALHTPYVLRYCKFCKSKVAAIRETWGPVCSHCNRRVQLNYGLIVLLILVGVLVVILLLVFIGSSSSWSTPNGGGSLPFGSGASVEPWAAKASRTIQAMDKSTQDNIGKAIVTIGHSTGTFKEVTQWSVQPDGDGLAIQVGVDWTGAFSGSRYAVVILWRLRENQHVGVELVSDNSQYPMTKSDIDALNAFFRDKLWPVLQPILR